MEPRRREGREGIREEEKRDFFSFVSRDAQRLDDELESLAHVSIGAAIEVHRLLGPGLPEVVYRNALSHELTWRGVPHQVEAPVPVLYKGLLVGEGHVDILVAERLVLELKVVEALGGIQKAQVIAYLSALNLQLGLLLNFNVVMMTDGIRRVIRS
jgi:GxxExxY protein